jgi:hypothetical protein
VVGATVVEVVADTVVGVGVVVVGAAVVVVGAAVVVVVGATVDGTSTVVVVDRGGYEGKLVTVVGGSVLVGTVELVVVVLVGRVELVVVVLVGRVELVVVVLVGSVELVVVVVVVDVVGGVAPPPGRSPSKLPLTEAAYTKPSSWPLLNVNVALGAKMLTSTPAPDIDKLVASGKLRSVLARNAST